MCYLIVLVVLVIAVSLFLDHRRSSSYKSFLAKEPWRKDPAGYYVLELMDGNKRALAHWAKFEHITDARAAIGEMNPKGYGVLHVGHWNGKEWTAYFDA